jgi:hypothetical protein
MKSVIINPRDKNEFTIALTWLQNFGKEHNLLTLHDDDTIAYVFLKNIKDDVNEIPMKIVTKKSAHKM